MNTLIVTGGNINIEFLKNCIVEKNFNIIIAVDKGLEALNAIKVNPNYIIGDFDSINKEILNKYKNTPITYLNPEKDVTDTHMALKLAMKLGVKTITIVGGIGTRIDHTLANIHILKEALENKIYVELVNENNKILLINDEITITRDINYKYISIIPLTNTLKGITLKGFKYSLNDAILEIGQSIGVSNEQIEEEGIIKIKEGIAILIYSRD